MSQEEQREAILDGLIDGRSLRAICKDEGMPTVTTVMRWCASDVTWCEQYARARQAGDDAMAEDIQEIADRTDLDPNDKKVRVDARKWLLAKRQPRKYGDSTMIKHADANGEAVKLDEASTLTRLASLVSAIQGRTDEPADDAG